MHKVALICFEPLALNLFPYRSNAKSSGNASDRDQRTGGPSQLRLQLIMFERDWDEEREFGGGP